MSISPSSNSNAGSNTTSQTHFPEQRVQTIADALGVYLTTSFCDSIVRHSGQSLEELAAQGQSLDAASRPVPVNPKDNAPGIAHDKSNRAQRSKCLTWFSELPASEAWLDTVVR